MEQHPATDYKTTCIKPECGGQEFTDVLDKDGSVSPARKCVQCGVVSVLFTSKL